MPTTRKIIYFLGVLALTPLAVFAAYNDVTLGSGSVLTVNGATLSVSGGGATIQSITVDSSTFDVTLGPNSNIQVTSSAARDMTATQVASLIITGSCTSNESVIGIT